jgi:hypothetical protein
MQLPKLLLSSEEGSAPVDFVIVILPTSLLLLALLGLFGLFQGQITLGQVSYDLARFASLADVNQSEIETYRLNSDASASITRAGSGEGCLVEATVTKVVDIIIWPEPIILRASSRATCEID